MPELPEVETVRMGLEPVLEGHKFTHVVTRRADLRRPFPKDFAKRLTGRKVKRLWRRAKYLLADLDQGVQWDHLSVLVSDVEMSQVVGLQTIGVVGLDVDLEHLVELVEDLKKN